MRNDAIRRLYEQLKATPYPAVAQEIEFFEVYDAALAGLATRAASGERVSRSDLPRAPTAAITRANLIRKSPAPSQDEQDFLSYIELLDTIAAMIAPE